MESGGKDGKTPIFQEQDEALSSLVPNFLFPFPYLPCFIFLPYKTEQQLLNPKSSMPFSHCLWVLVLWIPRARRALVSYRGPCCTAVAVSATILWEPTLGGGCMGETNGWEHWGFMCLPALTQLPESVRIIVSAIIKPEEFLSLPAGMRAPCSLSVCWESLTWSQDYLFLQTAFLLLWWIKVPNSRRTLATH